MRTPAWYRSAAVALVGSLTIGTGLAADLNPQEGIRTIELSALGKKFDDLNATLLKLVDQMKLADQQTQRELSELKAQVGQLQRDVDALRARQATPPPPLAAAPITTYKNPARVRFVNHYVMPMDVLVNSEMYRIPPGATQELTVSAGRLPFMVYQVHSGMQSTEMMPGELRTFTLQP